MPKVRQSTPGTSQQRSPVWTGPNGPGQNGGVTFSAISRYLSCRHRFYVSMIEGLRPEPAFSHRIEYGSGWHCCEEALAKGVDWQQPLKEYYQKLCRQYPLQQEEISHWLSVTKVQFPLYVEYWSKHKDVSERTPLLQEHVFDVKYKLPSGRFVRLRGKFDSVDIIGIGRAAGVFLKENKTKGDIDEQQIKRQMQMDLQVMIYLVALDQEIKLGIHNRHSHAPIAGVFYNVVRRPLSGGAGTIRQHKPTKKNPEGESKVEFYSRLSGIIAEAPESFFMRWRVETIPSDIVKFRKVCLDPILESILDDYEWWSDCYKKHGDVFNYMARKDLFKHHRPRHWIHPFGSVNALDEYGHTELDQYILNGSTVGLRRTEVLFTELQEDSNDRSQAGKEGNRQPAGANQADQNRSRGTC